MKTGKTRNFRILIPGLFAAALLGGCASTPPAEVANAEPGAAEAEAPAAEAQEVKVVQNAAQAEKYLTEEQLRAAKRECLRKMRKVTGSRIPRNACQGSTGLFSQGYNQQQENNSPRGTLQNP